MNTQVHLLNGDALLAQFPKSISGELLICRECLVEGPVQAKTLTDFFEQRLFYLQNSYKENTINYQEKVAEQFYRLQSLAKEKNAIHLWFEDDLFCQVNLWFCLSLLFKIGRTEEVYLIRPPKHTLYGFGNLSLEELLNCFKKKTLLTEWSSWNSLWEDYQNDLPTNMLKTAQKMAASFPFVLPAVQAHIERIPTATSMGRPKEQLKKIILALGTTSFGLVFQAFCEKEAIYGFGDLTVKRLFDEVFEEINN